MYLCMQQQVDFLVFLYTHQPLYFYIRLYRKDRGMLIIYEPALLYVFSLLWGVCCVKLICAFRTKLCEGIEFRWMETCMSV